MRITGEYRESINAANHEGGGIHDDKTATKLGFRGGTVAGSIHLDLFPPVLLEAFGKEWFETGSLSIGFKNATLSQEPVRAMLEGDGNQVRAWIERNDGMLVGEGTASVGKHDAPTALRSLDLTAHEAPAPRILAGVRAGDEIPTSRHHVSARRQEELLDKGLVTEVLDWYRGDSPWGGAVVLPQQVIHVLYTAAVAHLNPIVTKHGGHITLHRGNPPQFMHVPDAVPSTVVAFNTDVPWLSALGKPMLFGPGSILDAHGANEKIGKKELLESVETYRDTVARLLTSKFSKPEAGAGSGAGPD